MTVQEPARGVLPPSTGVGRIEAGTHITVSPPGGTGVVTISASGAGGGEVDTVVAGTAITVDSTDPANPIVTNNGVRSITAGTGVTVTGTANVPIINATGGGGGTVDTVVAGTAITVDSTDPANPIVTNNGVRSITAGTGVTVTGTANVPIINATGGGGSTVVGAFKPANTNRSGTATPTDDPDLTVALTAGTWYVEGRFSTVSGINTFSTLVNYAFSGTNTSNRGITSVAGATVTGAPQAVSTLTTQQGFAQTPSNGLAWDWTGFIVVTVPGNLTVQWCQSSADGTPDTMFAGSTLVATQIA